jgi:hypothetical protein
VTTIARRRTFDALRLTLAVLLLSYVWRFQDLVPGVASLKIPTIATGVSFLILLVDRGAQRQLVTALHHRIGRLAPWFGILAAISVAAGINFGWSLDYFVRDLIPALSLVLVVPAGVFEPEDTSYFAALQIFGAAVYCCVILTRFDVGADGRLGSLVFYDGNDIGMLLVCTIPLCVYFARHASHSIYRLISLGIALLFMYTIAKTGSRGAFLGLLAVGSYILISFRTIQPSIRLGVVGVCAGLLVLAASTRYWTQMETILKPTTDYNWVGNDDQGRMSIWKRGIQYAEDRPLTGVGVAGFNIAEGTISPLARRQEYEKGLKWSSPHNSFVQVLAEMGLPGVVLFIAMLVAAFRSAARLARSCARRGAWSMRYGELARAHVAAIAGYSVAGFFLSQAYAPYLYFVLGMIIGLDVTVRRVWRAEDATLEEIIASPETAPHAEVDARTEVGALVWS